MMNRSSMYDVGSLAVTWLGESHPIDGILLRHVYSSSLKIGQEPILLHSSFTTWKARCPRRISCIAVSTYNEARLYLLSVYFSKIAP